MAITFCNISFNIAFVMTFPFLIDINIHQYTVLKRANTVYVNNMNTSVN